MNLPRRIIGKLRDPDAGLLRDLRRFMSIAILSYGLLAFLLIMLYLLASTAPHPLALFLGDLVLVLLLPLLLRIMTAVFLLLLLVLMIMRTSVSLRLRRTRR